MWRGQGQQQRRRPAHVGVVMRLVQPRSSKATYFLFAELCMVAVECWASQSVTWVQQSGIPSGYVTSQLGHLSLAALQGRLIKYQLWLGLRQECHLCRVAGNTVWSCMWVPVAVWQVRLRTAMLYFSLVPVCLQFVAVTVHGFSGMLSLTDSAALDRLRRELENNPDLLATTRQRVLTEMNTALNRRGIVPVRSVFYWRHRFVSHQGPHYPEYCNHC